MVTSQTDNGDDKPRQGTAASALPHPDLIEVARTYEPERYLAATLAPATAQPALIAVAAYAADLQRIAATATQPMLGEIRLQWWRDSLATMAQGGRIGSPLADALGAAIAAHELPEALLVAMSEARAFDLYDDPMPDEAALDGYLSKTEALAFELSLRILGARAGDAGRLGRQAGRIFGLTRLLLRLPEAIAARRVLLPDTVLSLHGLTQAQLFDVPAANLTRQRVSALVGGISGEVADGLAALRPAFAALPRGQRSALLPLATVPWSLAAVARPNHDPTRDIISLAPLGRVWRIGCAFLLGRI